MANVFLLNVIAKSNYNHGYDIDKNVAGAKKRIKEPNIRSSC